MAKYKYSKKDFSLIENSCIPAAVYKFVNNQIVTVTVSKGFLELFGVQNKDLNEVYEVLNNDMYRDCYQEDIARIEEAALRFEQNDEPYNVIYRSELNGSYHIIHAFGKHRQNGKDRVSIIWYVDEGEYQESADFNFNILSAAYSNMVNVKNTDHVLNYDYLTGLPTISYFFYLADTYLYTETIKKHETPVMLFLDLNGMKYFNAKYGFAEGDKLIVEFSKLLTKFFSNNCCCRFGMDRFCVFTNDINLEERLWDLFAECENINNGRTLPVRVGIYSKDIQGCTVNIACDRAKMACDSSKKFSLSKFTYFDKSMLEAMENRQYIINNIDKAIKEKWIQVYYQPIIRAANGLVCDEEALSRWIDPVKGFMNPAEFIPVLEDTNLIYKLDLYVAEQILEKMKAQKKSGLYVVPISVNLSRSDFQTCDIVEEIHKLVQEAEIPPDKLTIEITESIMGQDFEYMKSQINRFQALGFKVWMDDFGSGYSSLDVLHDLHFNLIKFDMKFMEQFYQNEKSKIILSGLIKTAMGLGIETVCEGVETEHQAEFLKEVGCTKLQGFYYGPPIPSEKVYEKYEKGLQIGFENPEESEYYSSLGRINLYDLSSITNSEGQIFQNVFNTLPMAIHEINGTNIKTIRANNTYKEFLKKYFGAVINSSHQEMQNKLEDSGNKFLETIEKCKNSSAPIIMDDYLASGTHVHVYIKRVAVNPITNVMGIVTVILGVN